MSKLQISVAVPVTVSITPEILAEAFWELDDLEQVTFFNHLGLFAPQDEFLQQMHHIIHHTRLTPEGYMCLKAIELLTSE